jgi:hypothetical protein
MGGVVICATPATAQTWTNMPSVQTELFGTTWGRRQADLASMTQFRIIVNQSSAAFAGATFRAEFSVDGGANWSNLEAAGTGADLDVGTGTGLKVGAWGTMATGSAADVQLRIQGQGSNGALDPAFRLIEIEFK